METLTKINNKGFNLGKKSKISQSKKLKLNTYVEKKCYNKFVEEIVFLCIASQVDIPIELIDTESDNFSNIAQAFLMGLHNGSLEKDGE